MSLLCSSDAYFFFSIYEIFFNLTFFSPLGRFSVLKGTTLSEKITEREYVSFLTFGVAGIFTFRISPVKLPGWSNKPELTLVRNLWKGLFGIAEGLFLLEVLNFIPLLGLLPVTRLSPSSIDLCGVGFVATFNELSDFRFEEVFFACIYLSVYVHLVKVLVNP